MRKTGDVQPDQLRRRLLVTASLSLIGCGIVRPLAAAPYMASQPVSDKPHDLVNIHDFQSGPTSDWTAAFRQASAVARRVYFPAGEYTLRSAILSSDTELFGDGDATVLRMPPEAETLLVADSGSADISRNVLGLHLHDIQLRATAEIDGISEFRHLVSLHGVTGARFSRVLFKGFRGDGLYLGSGMRAGVERHNANIVIESCRFDGVNRANRNAVTVIDCDGLLIEHCEFLNTTQPNMPGAIDMEPNTFPFHIIRNVRIRQNRFDGIGGNVGAIAVYVPAQVAHPPENIIVEDNVSLNYVGSGAFFSYNDNRRASSTGPDNHIKVLRNRASGGACSFSLASGKGITLQENTFTDFTQGGRIGAPSARHSVRNLQVLGNTMTRCGTRSGSALYVYSADHVHFSRNKFIESGSSNAASAIMFVVGRSSYIEFVDNEFRGPTGRVGYAVQSDTRHVFDPSTNRFSGNQINGLGSVFPVTG